MTNDVIDQLEKNLDSGSLDGEVSDELIAILRGEPDAKKDWERVNLDEVAFVISGGTPKTSEPEYWGGEIPWVSIKDIVTSKSGFVYQTEKSITAEGLNNSAVNLLGAGDIIISARGTVGEVCRVASAMTFNQSCYGLVARKGVDKNYLFYLVTNLKSLISKNVHGSVFDTITRETFSKIILDLPPLNIQKQIADLLSVFDKKIDLLRAQNKTLESIAQTIYKRWFVDFEFPMSKEDAQSLNKPELAGQPYKSSGGKMKPSELGDIPDSWEKSSYGSIVNIFDTLRIPLAREVRERRMGIYPYYGATEVIGWLDDYLFDGLYLLFAEDGSVQDEYGKPVLQLVDGKIWVGNHAHVLQGSNGFSTSHIYMLSKNINVGNIVTGAVQPKINQNNLLNLPVVVSDQNILNIFNTLCDKAVLSIKYNEKLIDKSTVTRHYLSSKLFKVM